MLSPFLSVGMMCLWGAAWVHRAILHTGWQGVPKQTHNPWDEQGDLTAGSTEISSLAAAKELPAGLTPSLGVLGLCQRPSGH